MKLLIEHGADVNAVSQQGWTALRVASERGNTKAFSLLLDHGADSSWLLR